MKSSQIVIGCGFGDEGKGKVVSYLCSQSTNPLVIRFCGGHQAGHHVVLSEKLDHVFSNFGSGTLQGFDSYWSQFCTVDPVGILNELDVLKSKGVDPVLYLNEYCPVTTCLEKISNKDNATTCKHGTCGVGIGQTFKREEDHHSILVRDLYNPTILKIKMQLLSTYYGFSKNVTEFISDCQELISAKNIIKVSNMPDTDNCAYDRFIFEGSQGLLLDQNIGFFPHVTRGNTGTINPSVLEGVGPADIYLVTRAYQTRHGNGPMTNEMFPHRINTNPYENNFDSGFQGKFRRSLLDLDLLRYAVQSDYLLTRLKFTLVITCLDLLVDHYALTCDETLHIFKTQDEFVAKIKKELGAKRVLLSTSPLPLMSI
jgi:adenylosuccinate synthase